MTDHLPIDPSPTLLEERPEVIEFYQWLGSCVSGWAFIDRRLYQILHHALGFEQKQSAFLYYRNRVFNQRLRMVDDAAKLALSKEDFENKWAPLRKRTEDLSHTRNIFAHHPTFGDTVTKDGKSVWRISIHIEPYERILNNEYPGLRDKNELRIEDLKDHVAHLARLQADLEKFARFMDGLKASGGSASDQ